MLPLTVPLSRSAAFAQEEWEDVLGSLANSLTDPWTSILLSGGLASFNPEEALVKLSQMERESFDDGLTEFWALWWAATMEKADSLRPPSPKSAPTPALATPAPPLSAVSALPTRSLRRCALVK